MMQHYQVAGDQAFLAGAVDYPDMPVLLTNDQAGLELAAVEILDDRTRPFACWRHPDFILTMPVNKDYMEGLTNGSD